MAKVFKKEELRNVDGTDALHPNRSGDVVVVFHPPYQTDAQTPGQTIAFSQFFGQHGYTPDLVNLKRNVNMHATFIASGENIRETRREIRGVRSIDVAPTIAFLMGIPGPQNAQGKILYDIVDFGGRGHHGRGDDDRKGPTEITILDISDYHGQLVPLTDIADTSARRRGPLLVHHRRLGVPEAVVRQVPQGSARRLDHDRSRRLGRRDAADLELLRRHAHDGVHEQDGLLGRRAREPQLRRDGAVPP